VAHLGGTFRLDSRPGAGTRVAIALPARSRVEAPEYSDGADLAPGMSDLERVS